MTYSEKHYFVNGYHDVPIHVVATGKGTTALVFTHGLTHTCYCWDRQLKSDLNKYFQLVAYDLRGHGESGRPSDDYEKSEAWATDLHAVIESIVAEKIIVVGWSYGGMVISDYIRHFGQEKLAGIIFTNASTRIGVPGREHDISEAYKALGPALASNDMTIGASALGQFVCLCVKTQHEPRDYYKFVGMVADVSPAARSGILLRHVSNDDILKSLKVPTLLIHGTDDQIVLKSVSERHATLIPNVQTRYYENCGHCAFWEKSDQYNRDIFEFVNQNC